MKKIIISFFLFLSVINTQPSWAQGASQKLLTSIKTFEDLRNSRAQVRIKTSYEVQAYSKKREPIEYAYVEDLLNLLALDTIHATMEPTPANIQRNKDNWQTFLNRYQKSQTKAPYASKELYALFNSLKDSSTLIVWRNFLFGYFDKVPDIAIDNSYNVLLFQKCTLHHFWNQYAEAAKCVETLNNAKLENLTEKPRIYLKYLQCSSYFELNDLANLEKFKSQFATQETSFLPTNATFVSLIKDEINRNYPEAIKKIDKLLAAGSPIKPESIDYADLILRKVIYLIETKNLPAAETELNRASSLPIVQSDAQMKAEFNMVKSLLLSLQGKQPLAWSSLPDPSKWSSYLNFDDYLSHVALKCSLTQNQKKDNKACVALAKEVPDLVKGITRPHWKSKSLETIVDLAAKSQLTPAQTQKLNALLAEANKTRDSLYIRESARLLLRK